MPFPSLTFAFADALLYTTQVSLLAPLAVVWWRWPQFTGPVRRLSLYVYLALLSVVTTRFFLIGPGTGNSAFLIGFNCARLILLGTVYYQVLKETKIRQLIAPLIVASLIGTLVVAYYNLPLALSVSRAAQCTLLSGFALLYLDQLSTQSIVPLPTQDALSLVSIGQLLFSALTITAFSFQYVAYAGISMNYRHLFIALGNLAFNVFLTLAFLRATRPTSVIVSPQASF